MIIAQRCTAIDPQLLHLVCPFLRSTGLDRVIPVARLWHATVREPVPPLAPILAVSSRCSLSGRAAPLSLVTCASGE